MGPLSQIKRALRAVAQHIKPRQLRLRALKARYVRRGQSGAAQACSVTQCRLIKSRAKPAANPRKECDLFTSFRCRPNICERRQKAPPLLFCRRAIGGVWTDQWQKPRLCPLRRSRGCAYLGLKPKGARHSLRGLARPALPHILRRIQANREPPLAWLGQKPRLPKTSCDKVLLKPQIDKPCARQRRAGYALNAPQNLRQICAKPARRHIKPLCHHQRSIDRNITVQSIFGRHTVKPAKEIRLSARYLGQSPHNTGI